MKDYAIPYIELDREDEKAQQAMDRVFKAVNRSIALEMKDEIKRVLSGSCTPAHDLMCLVRAGLVPHAEALEAFNARFPLDLRIEYLEEAEDAESEYQRLMDI